MASTRGRQSGSIQLPRPNVGCTDRVMRLIIGVVSLALGAINANHLGLVGLVLIATSGMRWCPAYQLLGLSTRPRSED
jgi:hypothetical protein